MAKLHSTMVILRNGAAALAVVMLACSPVLAQQDRSAKEDARVGTLDSQRLQTEAELASLQSQISLSDERRQALETEVSRIDNDAATINRNLIETSARSRAIEERIERVALRLEELRGDESQARQSLLERRALLIEVIAALQRMGYRPPPALLVTPEDALKSVRSAILLGAVLPEVREETKILATELNNLVRIREEISASRTKLETDMQALAEEEERLTLLFQEKKRLGSEKRAELARQTALAAELAGKATSLQSLIEQLNTQISAVREAQEAARLAEEQRRQQDEARVNQARESVGSDGFADTTRISPAMAFDQARGLLPRPVAGVVLSAFNQKAATGEISRGQSIATRSGSRVLSPSDGWVIYAGPFRSYGQLLIVNAGDGYHVVMAGMERIDATLGQFVLAGEPVGSMGGTQLAASNLNVNVGTSRPVLYVEFRKDGIPIDPQPWWAEAKLEESSG